MYDQDDMYGEFRQRNPMASASIALGIASLLSCTIFYIAIPCGALAVLCAILSRGRFRLQGKAKAGIVCGVIGMIFSAVVTATAVHTVFTTPVLKARLEQTMQYYLGDPSFDLDEMLESLIPSLGGFGKGDPEPSAGDAEEETEDRVHLRIAGDAEETESLSENGSGTEDISEDDSKTEERETAPGENETEEETAEDPGTESGTDKGGRDGHAAPVTIPEGGGSFI